MSQHTSISRRHFLKGVAATGFGTGAVLTSPLHGNNSGENTKSVPLKAKNLIFMVSDGMNNGTFAAANHWLNIFENRDSEWMQLYKSGIASRSLAETACANCLVTDSAAASSAWGIGQRVNKGAINVTPDGKEPTPIALLAKAKGKSAGMVSTARITHATPAGFAANVLHRDQDPDIAVQYLEREIDVLLGGGDKHFNPEKREDNFDLYAGFKKAGHQIIKSRKELAKLDKSSSEPLLGVFWDDHLPYYIDRSNQKAIGDQVPSLEEMTAVAINRLSKNQNGFVLQIEAARVDHAGHANDPATIVTEQLEFDRTIALVRKFAENNGETAVIVTSDHGTGGFMLCGADEGYEHSQEMFKRLSKCTGSYELIQEQVQEDNVLNSLIQGLESKLSIVLTDTEKTALRQAVELPDELGIYNSSKTIGMALKPIMFSRFAVNWNCFNHTADLVEFAMFGPGKGIIPAYHENWQVHAALRELLDI